MERFLEWFKFGSQTVVQYGHGIWVSPMIFRMPCCGKDRTPSCTRFSLWFAGRGEWVHGCGAKFSSVTGTMVEPAGTRQLVLEEKRRHQRPKLAVPITIPRGGMP